jgi:uncharacterized protein (TIGR00369 family)
MRTPQANSNYCFVCGLSNKFGLKIRFFNTDPGEVTAQIIIPEQYQGYPGVVHGGIVAAILDEAAGRSMMFGEQARFMFTAKLEIRYRKNVPVGELLKLIGHSLESKSRTAKAKSALYDQQNIFLAEAEVLLVDVPGEMTSGIDLDALGWKVYSEDAS